MAEKYYKVAESDLVAIADAIRLQKKSEKKYQLKDFARIIKEMYTLPSGSARTETLMEAEVSVVGILPMIYKGSVDCDVNLRVNPTCVGVIPDFNISTANSVVNMAIITNAVGVLTE